MTAAQPQGAPGWDDAELVEELGAAVGGEYHALEVAMLVLVANELRRRPGDPAALRNLQREGRRMVAQVDPRRIADAAVTTAGRAGVQSAGADLGLRVTMTTGIARQMSDLAREMSESLAALHGPAAAWMPQMFRQASGLLTSSTQDDQRAIASRYLANGIAGKRYANGAWMPIGSYAEMVARTVTHQAVIVGRTMTQRAHGLDLVSIVTAADACASCASNRGKVWSIDGTPGGIYTYPSAIDGSPVQVTVHGALAAASQAKHFRGPNCRCQVVAVHPGLPVVQGPRHDPVAEKQRDRQRALERDIRRWKMREAAALDDMAAATARRHVRRAQARMRAFLDETGRNRRSYREQLEWATGPRVPTPTPARVV